MKSGRSHIYRTIVSVSKFDIRYYYMCILCYLKANWSIMLTSLSAICNVLVFCKMSFTQQKITIVYKVLGKYLMTMWCVGPYTMSFVSKGQMCCNWAPNVWSMTPYMTNCAISVINVFFMSITCVEIQMKYMCSRYSFIKHMVHM